MSDEKRKTKRNMDVTSASKSVTLSKMAGLVACVYLVFFTSAVICVRTEIDGDQVVRLSGSQDAIHHQRFARAAKFTIEELINTEFPLKDSNDLDLDPCKAGTFMGDIAIPDASRDRSISEEERQSIKALQQEVETLKKEVLLEGLQVEEEGLTDIIRKRTKLPPADTQKGDNFNDPLFGMEVNKDRKIDASIADKSKQELNFRHGGSNDVNLVTENVDTKKAETATPTVVTENSSTSSTPFLATTTDKSKNVEVIEQDGILIVNISSSNILTRDTILELTKTKEKTHITDQDLEEKKGKIQSNSKEITGDANGNFHKAKETTTSKADIESTTVSRRQNTLRSSGEVERSSSPKQVSSAETKNKHRRRRHNKRKRLINSSSSSINLSEQTPNSSYSSSNSEEEFSKRRRHNIRHGSHASPYYSRILKLKDELNTEDYIEGTKRSLSNYNGSIAIEKKTKNEFRDDLEQGILEPNFKKLDTTEEYEITNQPNESVTEKIYVKQNDYEPKMKKFEYPIHEFEQKFEYKPKPKNLTTETLNETFVAENLTEVLLNFSGIEMFQSETMAGLLGNHSMDGQLSWNLTQDPTLLQDLDHTHDEEDNHEEHDHRRVSRAATGRKERIWEHGVIPYEIDGNFSGAHKALFKQAMRHWENFTCVKFVERQPADHVNYIVFTERQCGCCSFVGKRGNGAQAISIGKNCDKFGIVVHELGHVVGFWHEHTRPDRDNHVQIIRDNIMTGQEYNFNKLTDEEVNSLGQGYDYDSIMHYARNTFSKGTYLDTILPLEVRGKKRPEIGQRVRLSESDIAQTNLLYKCHKCGRTLQENSGSFSSPSYHSGSPSPEGERCEWRITATHGERIVLNITDLDIFKSNNCQSDYLEVRDGYWQRSVVLGRFCGAGRAVPAVLSSGPRLLLHYVSSAREVPSRGFMAHYEAVCGGELDLEAGGHLESPNYPDDYQPNKECVWKLTVPYEFQVALKFQSFEVENHDNCVYDYVEVRDGHSADSPLVGIFCGYKIPPDIRSTSNKLLVKFVSDGSVQKAGFSASFMQEYDECSLLLHGCQHDCINTLGGYECSCNIGYELHSDGKSCVDACGGVFDAPNGTITSPSFPELYPADKSCMWEIIAPPQHRITLNFTHFDIEGNNIHQEECEYDSLTVHSKLGADVLRRQGVYCGTRLPPSLVSEGNALRLIFTSDKSVQKSGFSAIYYTDNDECATNNGGCQHECRNTAGSYVCSCHNGFMLDENKHDCKEGGCKHEVTQPQGTINSPNYPDNYLPRKDCVWHFTTTPGHRIKLMFDVFEMEPHQECAYDHVVVYDGNSPDSPKLGRFCGSKSPHIIIANSNEMYMVFKSDASVQRKGFLATHNTVCGGRLMATSHVKHLYSHARFGDDQKYDIHTECEWTIEAPPGYSVQLTFLNFHLEEESSCGFDYVEVFNGPDANSGPSYGRFCGTNIPTEIISMTESLLIRFRTDDSVVEKGFSASYVAVEPESIDSEEMALSRASSSSSMNSRSGYSGYSGYSGQSGHSGRGNKWGKHRNSRVQHPAPYFQRHLKQVDHHSSQRTGHKYL